MSTHLNLTDDERRAMRQAASQDLVRLLVNRNDLLMLVGWIQANRPETDWDPSFISNFLGIAIRAAEGND